MDVVAGTVHEVVAIARSGNYRTCHVIHLASLNALTSCQLCAYESDGSIACFAYNFKYLALVQGKFIRRAGEGHPGIVGINGVGLWETCPEIKQDQVAALNRIGRSGTRLIVWIAGVAIDPDNGRFRCHQTGILDESQKTLLHLVFVQCYAVAQIVTELSEERIFSRDQSSSCLAMALDLFFR